MTNYFRKPDALVDAVNAVLSGQPVQEKMDPVDQKALKGKHSDRKDKDIDNDGDVDSSDEYLHKRRKAVSKAMKEEDTKLDEMKQKFALVDKDNKVVSTGSDERDLRLNRPSLQRKFGELKLVQIKKKQDIGYPLKEEDTKLDEAVKPGNVKLKSGESVMLSKDDAEAINDAMKELNSSNKKKMQDELMKDKKSFMSMVKFAKTAA
jgi:prefoldin subunit 5